MFSSVEAKVFAYAAILVSIGLAWRGKSLPAVIVAALATYFHFLVGGFWAAAVILLIGLKTESPVRAGRLLLIYTILILPIFVILLYQWFLAPMPDVSDLDLTVNQIYSVFRVPHHVAPFSSLSRLKAWLPGMSWMVAIASLLALLARQCSERGLLARWLLVLYVYLILAFALAFLDRHTYFLGPLYLFRPNSLILLLTLMLGMLWLRQSLDGIAARALTVVTLAATLGFAVPRATSLEDKVLFAPRLPLERILEPKDRELVDWLRANTHPNATVVIEPTRKTKWQLPWLGLPWLALERLINRPTLISFKFTPTQKAGIARWYRLIRWREAVFGGDCRRLAEQPADYLVTVKSRTLKRIAGCGDVVWTNGNYGVVQVAKP